MEDPDIRSTLLEIISEKDKYIRQDPTHGSLQSGSILHEAENRLGRPQSMDIQQAILKSFYDLFRSGILSWGHNLANPKPPFCHVTSHGRRILENLSRDPCNPEGYMAFLQSNTTLDPIVYSYIEEALNTYNSDCIKASSVMVGAATERLVLIIQESLVTRLDSLGLQIRSDLKDWRLKKILISIENLIKQRKNKIPSELFELFEAYWPAFTHQIRTARNDSGHPTSIDPVTHDRVHASLLIFPELVSLVNRLNDWINHNMNE